MYEQDPQTGLYEISTNVSYYRGSRMMRLGPMAQLLHHRAICFCLEHGEFNPYGSNLHRGWIHLNQLQFITFDIPDALAEVHKLCSEDDPEFWILCPLWETHEDGYGIQMSLIW